MFCVVVVQISLSSSVLFYTHVSSSIVNVTFLRFSTIGVSLFGFVGCVNPVPVYVNHANKIDISIKKNSTVTILYSLWESYSSPAIVKL